MRQSYGCTKCDKKLSNRDLKTLNFDHPLTGKPASGLCYKCPKCNHKAMIVDEKDIFGKTQLVQYEYLYSVYDANNEGKV